MIKKKKTKKKQIDSSFEKMTIGSVKWRNLILNSADYMGLSISDYHLDQFTTHADELVMWNRKTNLTAITDPFEIALKHYADSMACVDKCPEKAKILDIGTGAGFPGIVLKIIRPDLDVTLIDASRKKVSFLNHVIRLMGLTDIQALHVRAENMPELTDFNRSYDIILCRALSSLKKFITWAQPLISGNGLLIAMKGKAVEEIDDSSPFIKGAELPVDLKERGLSMSIESYRLPRLNSRRTLYMFNTLQ